MGVTLKHAIKISATPDRVFQALTDPAQVASWHEGTVEGEVATGSVLFLDSKPGLRFGWETKELVPNERLVQACVEGPGSSAGKTHERGRTRSSSSSPRTRTRIRARRCAPGNARCRRTRTWIRRCSGRRGRGPSPCPPTPRSRPIL